MLTEFVQLAIANNLDLAQSTARLDQASAQLRAARAGFLPQINANGQLQRAVGDFVSEDVQFSGGADASWEADLFGRIGGSVAASRADLAAAGYSLGDVQRLIVGQVALRTIEARSSALQLVIARNTLPLPTRTCRSPVGASRPGWCPVWTSSRRAASGLKLPHPFPLSRPGSLQRPTRYPP